jgi:hypothetical protein
MDNFLYGLEAVLSNSWRSMLQLTQYQLFWGFAIGFFMSTMVHAFLATDSPKQAATMVFQKKENSYQTIHQKEVPVEETAHFDTHSRQVDQMRSHAAVSCLLIINALFFTFLQW